jgi:hypothetical protein
MCYMENIVEESQNYIEHAIESSSGKWWFNVTILFYISAAPSGGEAVAGREGGALEARLHSPTTGVFC